MNQRLFLKIILTGFFYYLFGKLGLFIAIEPENISPIWLPAGVSLLALLLFGPKMGFGIYLGSFFLNFPFFLHNSYQLAVQQKVFFAACMALGAVMQAFVGLLLIQKWLPRGFVMGRVTPVLLFIFAIAPLSATVSASWGMSVLFLTKLISFHNFSKTWLMWWIGDVLGIHFITGLGILAQSQWDKKIYDKNDFSSQNKNSLKTFFAVLSSLVVALLLSWLLIIEIKKNDKIYIGIAKWVENTEHDKNIIAFKSALAKQGFIEGQNVEFQVNLSHAKKEEHEKIIKNYIKHHVSLIYSLTTPGTLIAKSLTSTIPVVFSIVTFPVETQLIASLNNSQNNLVGSQNNVPAIRQFKTFQRVYANPKNIGFVHRKGEANSDFQFLEFKNIFEKKNINIIEIAATDIPDLKIKLNQHIKKVDALYSACDTLIDGGGEDIVIEFVQKHKLPDFSCNKSGIQKGSLIGTTLDDFDLGLASGALAAKILNGTSPRSLSTYSPDQNSIMINMTRAEQLGIKVDYSLLEEAQIVFRNEVK